MKVGRPKAPADGYAAAWAGAVADMVARTHAKLYETSRRAGRYDTWLSGVSCGRASPQLATMVDACAALGYRVVLDGTGAGHDAIDLTRRAGVEVWGEGGERR